MTKMFLFSVFNLIKKGKGVSEEKIYRYTSNRSQTCNIKVTKPSPDFYRHSVSSVGRAHDCKMESGSILRTRPILRVLKYLWNEGTSFALQADRASRGLNDNVK